MKKLISGTTKPDVGHINKLSIKNCFTATDEFNMGLNRVSTCGSVTHLWVFIDFSTESSSQSRDDPRNSRWNQQWPQLQAPPTSNLGILWLAEQCLDKGQRSGRGSWISFLLQFGGFFSERQEEEEVVLWGGEEEEEGGEQHGSQQGEVRHSEAAAAGGVVCQKGLRRFVHRVIWDTKKTNQSV